MTKEVQFLKENSMGYLSTVDKDGKPRVRAFGIMTTDEGDISFGTSVDKDVYKQLKENNHIEYIASKGITTLRVRGDILFEENQAVIDQLIEAVPQIKSMYQGREQDFKLFYLPKPEYKWFTWQ